MNRKWKKKAAEKLENLETKKLIRLRAARLRRDWGEWRWEVIRLHAARLRRDESHFIQITPRRICSNPQEVGQLLAGWANRLDNLPAGLAQRNKLLHQAVASRCAERIQQWFCFFLGRWWCRLAGFHLRIFPSIPELPSKTPSFPYAPVESRQP